MHQLDIPMAESGGPFRPLRAALGLLRRVLCKLFYHPDDRLRPVAINQPLTAGEILPIAGGIEVIHTPGHCAGQVALLWRPGRILFACDVCMNIMGLVQELNARELSESPAEWWSFKERILSAACMGRARGSTNPEEGLYA